MATDVLPESDFAPFTNRQCDGIADLLKAVGHPVRLRVIDTLARGEICVGDLALAIGEKQAIVSQQLKILRLVGLVKTERRGGKAIYSINNPHVFELLSCMHRCACSQFPAE